MVVHKQRTGSAVVIDFMGSVPEKWGGLTTKQVTHSLSISVSAGGHSSIRLVLLQFLNMICE